MDSKKIRVAITHGDTNGIGYELIFKAFSEPEMLEYCTPIIYGSPKVAAYYRKAMNLPAQFSIIQKAEDAEDGRINLLPAVDEEVKVDMGMPTQESGTAAIKALDRAMTDYRDELFDVLVTAPVNNQNAQFEGFQFKGHKEYIETCLGEGAKGLSILCGGDLRIASVTGKTPLKDVPAAITQELIIEKVKQMHTSLKRDFMITNPRIAVLALLRLRYTKGLVQTKLAHAVIMIEFGNAGEKLISIGSLFQSSAERLHLVADIFVIATLLLYHSLIIAD